MMETKTDNPNYFGILPAPIRYDKRISSSAKLLYSELTALSNKEGYSWASNRYFSELYAVSEKQVSLWFKQLAEAGHLRFELTKKQGGTLRKVYPTLYQKVSDTLPKGKADTLPKGKTNNTSSLIVKENTKKAKDNLKASPSSEKKENDLFFKPVIEVWFKHHPDWQFSGKDGAGIKAIIQKLNKWQIDGNKTPTPESTAAAFDYVLSHQAVTGNNFLSTADPSTLNSKLNTIFEQLKNTKNGNVNQHRKFDPWRDSKYAPGNRSSNV